MMLPKFDRFIHKYSVSLVFFFMVVAFAATSWKQHEDGLRIDGVVAQLQASTKKHDFEDCLNRNTNRAAIVSLAEIILTSPSLPADRADVYKKLVDSLKAEDCPKP